MWEPIIYDGTIDGKTVYYDVITGIFTGDVWYEMWMEVEGDQLTVKGGDLDSVFERMECAYEEHKEQG